MKKFIHKSIVSCLTIHVSRLTMIIFFATLLFHQTTIAQAPTLTTNIGIPTGSISGVGVAYGNGVYVSAFYNGIIYTSSNGTSWTKVSGVPAGIFSSLTFGAGVFVITGQSGLILSSTNGTTWTIRVSGTTEYLNDVKYLQGAFYAVGMNTTLLRSTDGISWSPVTLGTGTSTDMFLGITYGNGQFVISARNSGGSGMYIYRSATGNSNLWTFQDVASGSIDKVLFLKDRFFIFCLSSEIYTSTDASTWTNSTASMILTLPDATTQTIGFPNQTFNGIYDGTTFYFFGSSQYDNGYGSIFYSTDGVNFTLAPKTAYIVCQGSAYINNKYFEYGNEGIVASSDGMNYKYPSGSYNAIASSGSSYVGVGGVSQAGVIFSSTDFVTWTERTPSAQNALTGVVYTGTKYVTAGDRTVLQSTDNGITWTQIATPVDYISSLAYGSSRFVSVGYNATTYIPRIAYSADGISWTTANTDNNYYFKVKLVNGNFFATGYSGDTGLGVVLYSTDGISWTDITPTLSFPVAYFNDVVYDGSKYHFMGCEYIDPLAFTYAGFFSVSTSTPTVAGSFGNKGTISSAPAGVTLGGYYGEGAFAYANGRFTGSVNDMNSNETYVIYSYDGISWLPLDVNQTTVIYGAIAEGNKFRLLGSGDGKITADFSLTILPVTLINFSATLVNDQSLLKWQTSSEQNSRDFKVQHSMDGTHWEEIGTVAAAGQSQDTRSYQFIHTNPKPGYNYYRLIQTDLDGKQQASPVRQVFLGKTLHVRLYPNPAEGSTNLELPNAHPATVSLINAGGQQVYNQIFNDALVQVPLKQLPTGIYQVVVSQDGQRFVQPLYHH